MNSSEVVSLLQESPLFKKVKSSMLASLLMKTSRTRLAAGQILLTPGQGNDRIYIVLSGRLRAQLNVDDAKPLALFGSSECVGEMSMFNDDQVSAYIIAATDCELLSIGHVDVWAILNESLQASHNMLTILAERIRSSNRMLAESMEPKQGYETPDYINPITGIYNDRWLSENIARLIQRQSMNQQPSAFILLKAENFGQYGALFGSLGSDEAQRTIAQTMVHCLRPNDVAAQFSADQFAIFLPQTQLENANKLTGRLREIIGQAAIVTPSGDALPPISLSIGVSQVQHGDTLDNLVARTHAAMHGE